MVKRPMREGTANVSIRFKGIMKSNLGPIHGEGEIFERGVVGGFINWQAIERFQSSLMKSERE